MHADLVDVAVVASERRIEGVVIQVESVHLQRRVTNAMFASSPRTTHQRHRIRAYFSEQLFDLQRIRERIHHFIRKTSPRVGVAGLCRREIAV